MESVAKFGPKDVGSSTSVSAQLSAVSAQSSQAQDCHKDDPTLGPSGPSAVRMGGDSSTIQVLVGRHLDITGRPEPIGFTWLADPWVSS